MSESNFFTEMEIVILFEISILLRCSTTVPLQENETYFRRQFEDLQPFPNHNLVGNVEIHNQTEDTVVPPLNETTSSKQEDNEGADSIAVVEVLKRFNHSEVPAHHAKNYVDLSSGGGKVESGNSSVLNGSDGIEHNYIYLNSSKDLIEIYKEISGFFNDHNGSQEHYDDYSQHSEDNFEGEDAEGHSQGEISFPPDRYLSFLTGGNTYDREVYPFDFGNFNKSGDVLSVYSYHDFSGSSPGFNDTVEVPEFGNHNQSEPPVYYRSFLHGSIHDDKDISEVKNESEEHFPTVDGVHDMKDRISESHGQSGEISSDQIHINFEGSENISSPHNENHSQNEDHSPFVDKNGDFTFDDKNTSMVEHFNQSEKDLPFVNEFGDFISDDGRNSTETPNFGNHNESEEHLSVTNEFGEFITDDAKNNSTIPNLIYNQTVEHLNVTDSSDLSFDGNRNISEVPNYENHSGSEKDLFPSNNFGDFNSEVTKNISEISMENPKQSEVFSEDSIKNNINMPTIPSGENENRSVGYNEVILNLNSNTTHQ